MNFIPLTRAERKRMEQSRRQNQQLSKINVVATNSHLSPVLESEGATTDREKVVHEGKKEEPLIQPQPIQEHSIQVQNVVVQPTTPQRSDRKRVEIGQQSDPKLNAAIQNSQNGNLQQDESNIAQILFENQQQKMSPKKSVKLKRDLTEVLDYAKPVEGFGFIQFIQSHYAPEENKQNHYNNEVSQSHLENANGKEMKASKRALNSNLAYGISERKAVAPIESMEEKVADGGRKSYRRNLSPNNILNKDSQKKVNLLPLKIEEQISISQIIASLNVVAQPSEERINDRLSQKLSRSLAPATVLSYQVEEKVLAFPVASAMPAKQKPQPISIDLRESLQKEVIEGNSKLFLRRNLQNSRYKPETGSLSQQISIQPVSNQHLQGSRASFLKRNLQGSNNFKPEAEQILMSHASNQMMEGSSKSYLKRNLRNGSKQPLSVSTSHKVSIDEVPQQVMEIPDNSRRSTRNLSRNVEPQPISIQPEQIQTSHRIRDQEALSQRSNSSVITQGWNNQKQIFKVFRLQPSGRNRGQNHSTNASLGFIKRPLNSLHLK